MELPFTREGRGRYLGVVDSSLLHACRFDSSDSDVIITRVERQCEITCISDSDTE